MTKLANFVFRSSLAIAIIFNIVAVGRAKAEDVNDFDELKDAITNEKKNIINVKQDIPFTNEIVINRSNLTISGPSKDVAGLLYGGGNHKLLTFGENAKNISLKNLHFEGGHDNRPRFIDGETNPEAGGGAINLRKGTEAILENITFSNSQTATDGGAICSRGIDNNRNSLTFGGLATFKNNSSAGEGGAIYGGNETKLTFGGDVTFTENSSDGHGGAIRSSGENAADINILKFEGNANFVGNSTTKGGFGNGGAISVVNSSLTFGGLATFRGNSSGSNGGAIYGGDRTKLIFGGEVIFTENSSDGHGGAIRSWGENAVDINILKFEGNANFVGNSTTKGGFGNGGAISVENSSLTFGGLATFKNNRSAGQGGVIYGRIGTELIFGGDVIFTENSSDGDGGAIRSLGENATNKNILKFEGNAIFVGNSATEGNNGYGGAIYAENSSLTFGGLATFENNRARNGGAIFASDGSSIEFRDGLRLIENTTGNTDSGALHMWGNSNGKLATITIVQKNPLVPTEFRGNTSGNGGHNAVFMQYYSQLN
ncbi:MAG: hypothetical protein LBB13_02045, partial [Rickettsiales bacterium]|nr:hypothetical protein [Rickettsiales bacterium]